MCSKTHAQIHCEIDSLASANKEALYAPYKSLDEGLYFLHFYENGQLTIKQLIVEH